MTASGCRSIRLDTGPQPGGAELTARAVRLAGLKPGARIVDIGCGNGQAVAWLRSCRGFHVAGVDSTRARFQPGLPLAEADAASLPFASGALDAVLAECSLSVMANREMAMGEWARVLAPGGRLMITDLYAREAGARVSCLPHLMEREEVERLLTGAGFRMRLWEDHSHVLRAFLFRYLMEGGSLDALCGGAIEGAPRPRLGYFLLIAEAKGKGDGR